MMFFNGMMGFGSGFGGITVILLWIMMILGIAALWKYVNKK
jgi:hypothetical protein